MDYEKKYKEALERAQQAVDKGQVSQNFVYDIFPEHKESRDERIKDEILRLVSISGNGNQYEEIRDWIAKLNDKDVLIKEQDALIKDQNELIKELGEYKTKYVRDSIIKSTTQKIHSLIAITLMVIAALTAQGGIMAQLLLQQQTQQKRNKL